MSERSRKSGFFVSGALHAALLAMILIGVSRAPKFDDAKESIPVDAVTASQFNEIMKGERDAKPSKAPAARPAAAAPAPLPPEPPPDLRAAEDTPPPPAPEPPPRPAPEPPPPPAPEPPPRPAPPAPEPPPRPAPEVPAPSAPEPPPRPATPKAEAPEPPAKPAPPKPAAEKAPEPPPKPVTEKAPEPPAKPRVAEKPPERPKEPRPDKPKADPLLKLIATEKTDAKDPAKERSRPAARPFDPNAINKLLGQTKVADASPVGATPQGLPNQHAARMSPSLSASLDQWFTDAYLSCWSPPPTTPDGERYVADVRVIFNPDGSLSGQPTLLNPPKDAAWRAHAESAVRAVLRCNPLHLPPQYAPYFEQWKSKTIHFDPQNALG